jgi:CDP-6-deoxy-D-xylo-4-hexulose-3-dehydrase
MNFKYPLAISSWGPEEINAMQHVISRGFFSMGDHVKEFEENFATYFDASYCVMVNSGSSANLLMIASLFYTKNEKYKLKRGDEVIVPAVSWSTTYYPLYQYGLKIKFVDIDLYTLNYDLNQLKMAITEKTKVILAVNLLGNANDFDEIQNLMDQKNIILLEDNCESMGATYNEKFTGTFGLMGTFSSFFSHHISTMEGGLIVTDDIELYQILLSLRAHGWTRNLPKENYVCSDKSDNSFEESFRFVLPGYNVRPIELEGAIGIEQLKKLPSMLSNRRKNAELFKETMKQYKELLIQKEIGNSSWFGFSIVIKPESEITRSELIKNLSSIGFECRPIVAGNFAKNEVIKYFDYEVFGDLKNANHIDRQGLFIGNQNTLMDSAMNDLKKLF